MRSVVGKFIVEFYGRNLEVCEEVKPLELSHDVARSGRAGKEKVPTRLSLAMRGAEGGTDQVPMDTRVSESRLATPSSGGRMSFKGSGIPVPVAGGTATDNAKLRRLAAQEGRGHSSSRQRQQ